MSLLTGLADRLDPPAPPAHTATPSAWAQARSRGRWHPAPHLALLEEAVLHTIETGGRLCVSVSVRHGKSEYASKWVPAWYLGTNPDRRVILAGHEADFAARWGRAARDILTEHGPTDFGVAVSPRSEAASRWDVAGHDGGMLTVGVGGSPIGRGADLLIVDDPIKSYEAAMSPKQRARVQEWWAGTMASRIEPGGAAVVICARWHEDDLTGWLLDNDDDWTELRLPAIADDPDDPLGRDIGEPLWPERWPLAELEKRRRQVTMSLGDRIWLAQYQQTPTTPEGGMFPEGSWAVAEIGPDARRHARWVRAWDLAATSGGGDWTVGVLLGLLPDGRVLVDDVVRGQWSPDEVRSRLTSTAATDPPGTWIDLPQDPGQAGKDQAQQLIRLLAGYGVSAAPVTGSKEVRATGLSAQQRAGNVVLGDGDWVGPFVAELAAFPRGRTDDQVDAAASAFNALVDVANGDDWFDVDDLDPDAIVTISAY